MFGTAEIIVVLLAALILFGGKRLPEIARNIGKGVRTLRRELKDFKDSIEADDSDKNRRSG